MEGGGGGEVRRVHVVYFLSRNGEMEQPHLIRVRQRARRDGVRLRDVKRWLSELRGKGMPDSFSWSYKRRYKTGYVWQDLADDDLITPVSDYEYVLKGSLTATATATATAASRPSSSSSTVLSCPSAATSVAADHASPPADSARTDPTPADPFSLGDPKSAQSPERAPAENPDRHDEVSPEPPSPADEEEEEETAAAADEVERSAPPPQHSDASTQTTRRRAAAAIRVDIPCRADPAAAGSPLPVSDSYFCEIEEEAEREEGGLREEKKGTPVNDSSHSLLPGRRRGYAWCGGAGGRAFRSLLGCGAGAAEVDDSALLPIEPRRRGQPAGSSDGGGRVDVVLSGGSHRDPAGAEARESREGGHSWSTSRAATDQKTKAVPAEAYKPAAVPSCSQCGRPFKPERLHAHMKSCRALRSQRRNMSSGKLQKGAESLGAMLSEETSALFLLGH